MRCPSCQERIGASGCPEHGPPVVEAPPEIAEVGPMAAVIKTFELPISDGTLNIDLAPSVDQPKISAIEVIPLALATPTPTATSTPTSTPAPAPPANITVYNTGGFFVQYYVSYNLPGMPLQSLYSGVFNINQGVTLTIPGNATNVGVLIQEYTGITGWQTACTRSYAQATTVVIIVSGTPFFATCTGG